MLIRKPVAMRLSREMGATKKGIWWELVAPVHRRGYTIEELPVHHCLRATSVTLVYHWQKMPGIFFRHFAAIFRI